MSYKYFENKECEFYPCHQRVKNFSCLFCYCPIYHKENCGGDFTTTQGVKDCTNCTFPHEKSNYDKITEKINIKNNKFL